MEKFSDLTFRYMRIDHLPHIWCSGCGNGILMRDVVVALDRLGLEREKTVVVSGIGCSSRAAGYMDFNTLHTTHGRALAFATGVKLANPSLTVIVITGDGDGSSIGGNHLIHAARRNIDITVVVFNNNTYGMTGGQFSPTTPTGDYGTTAPYGTIEKPFDIAALAETAGATYTARGTSYHTTETIRAIEGGIRHKGFSLIDCYSVCPTYYGRKNRKGDAVEMLTWQRDHAVDAKKFKEMSPEERADKFPLGVLFEQDRPEYTEEYDKLIARAKAARSK